MEFDVEVHNWPGRKHIAVDALSQLSANQTNDSDLNGVMAVYVMVDSHDEPVKRDKNEQDTSPISKLTAAQRKEVYCQLLTEKSYALTSHFLYDQRVRHALKTRTAGKRIQELVSLSLRTDLLKQEYDSTIPGHSGVRRRCDTLRRSYSWPHRTNDV